MDTRKPISVRSEAAQEAAGDGKDQLPDMLQVEVLEVAAVMLIRSRAYLFLRDRYYLQLSVPEGEAAIVGMGTMGMAERHRPSRVQGQYWSVRPAGRLTAMEAPAAVAWDAIIQPLTTRPEGLAEAMEAMGKPGTYREGRGKVQPQGPLAILPGPCMHQAEVEAEPPMAQMVVQAVP